MTVLTGSAWQQQSQEIFTAVAGHWLCLLALGTLAVTVVRLRRLTRTREIEQARERRVREELETYARLDVATLQDIGSDRVAEAKKLAKRVCRAIADKSQFTRVALLIRGPEGRLYCAGSAGVDDLTVRALTAWGEQALEDETRLGAARRAATSRANDAKSFAINLGEWDHFDREVSEWVMAGNKERRRWRRGLVAPVRLRSGRMTAVIAVCADRGPDQRGTEDRLDQAMGPIEMLAARLATSLENEALGDRVLRAEKLAGLGQLAGGVAHALNNPLTAVLGYAELIGETSSELRVRQDAETIRIEALKMRDTIQRLTEFWRPAPISDEPIELLGLLQELEDACRHTLQARGVDLLLTATAALPEVRGSRDRLKQVMEHLLNNSAQAIAAATTRESGHAIRIALSHDETSVHIIVSDTGTGFDEPGRVFDPFYTTRPPDEGAAGLGLSICYGIVREHGGEISAFNLHPHGAAVVVELPRNRILQQESVFLDNQQVA